MKSSILRIKSLEKYITGTVGHKTISYRDKRQKKSFCRDLDLKRLRTTGLHYNYSIGFTMTEERNEDPVTGRSFKTVLHGFSTFLLRCAAPPTFLFQILLTIQNLKLAK
jgi:hypothetical protein